MSEPSLPSSVVFTDPLSVSAPPEDTDKSDVNATTAPVQLGGVDVTWTTQAVAAGETAQVVVTGAGTRVNLGIGAADVQLAGGGIVVESIQYFDTATGAPIPDSGKAFNLGNDTVPYNGAVVNTAQTVVGDSYDSPAESISTAAGGLLPGEGIANYVSGGTGNDSVIGSSLNDFIRGGAGNDSINAGAGNDLVRGGAGNDTTFLGQGNDTLFYTIDQVGAAATDFVTDFTVGEDKIAVQGNILYTINGNQITFTGADGSTSTLTAQAGIVFSTSQPGPEGIIFIS